MSDTRTDSVEALRQAILEIDHLRQREVVNRRNVEMLLDGLQLLSIARSHMDSLESVLSILLPTLSCDAVCLVSQTERGQVDVLASTGMATTLPAEVSAGPLMRAFQGKVVVLNDATHAGCKVGGQAAGSAILQPILPIERPTVLICLAERRAGFGLGDRDKLRFFLPLASHGIRHSAKLTELQRAVEELERARVEAEAAARRDALTGLANRKGFDEAFSEILASDRADEHCCVIIDLDDFKPINDTFGHDAGDAVLIAAGERFQSALGDAVSVARIGGDEFAALVGGLHSREACVDVGRRLVAALEEPVVFNGRRLHVRASVGIAYFSDCAQSLQEIVSAADRAMYTIKSVKETDFSIYDPAERAEELTVFARQRLLEAIRTWELKPFFQPKVSLTTRALTGFEALARWVDREGGLLEPRQFLGAIKDHGLQIDFTVSMVRQVIDAMRHWREIAPETTSVAVNIPEAILATERGLEELLWLLADDGLGRHITCEITEDVLIARANDRIRQSIQTLREAGSRISLDDFGTGYGSFRHLQELQVDELKIDAEFVAGIGRDRSAEIIIEGFLAIARGLDICVVGEGIETETQARFLRRRQCQEGQGYLFGRAVEAARVPDVLDGDIGTSRQTA
ncbi:MAG: EAL domain-containing protein [Pseudomonadota bacterium]